VEHLVESAISAAAVDGIVTSSALVGISPAAIRHQVREQRLLALGRGVWKLRDHPWDQRCTTRAALALVGPGAAVGLRSAAHAYGWYRYRSFAGVEIVVRRGRDQRSSLGRIVQTRVLLPDHVVDHDGFPTTTPARTFFDLCADPDPGFRRRGGHPVHTRNMERVYNDIVARRGVTFTHEAAVHVVMARQGRRGTVLVREILTKFGPRYVPTQSEAESLFAELLVAHGIAGERRQVPISGPDGFIGTVDFFWPRARHIVEIDSAWHDGPIDEEDDEQRDDRLRAADYTVARYRYGQMIRDPRSITRELGVAIGVYTSPATPSS
jgi:very-short-patch-repair endonuclease